MTDLHVVRTGPVPVEEIQPGDVVVLPMGHRVTVDNVEKLDDGLYWVHWWRPAERGEPGFPSGSDLAVDADGRYLGSLMPVPAGHHWTVDRA